LTLTPAEREFLERHLRDRGIEFESVEELVMAINARENADGTITQDLGSIRPEVRMRTTDGTKHYRISWAASAGVSLAGKE
jgi:hypothetical protein